MASPALPIEPILPALAAALEQRGAAVLVAPPGAGKTTRVPLALLDAPWLERGRILMLEPRRLAARAAARRMAASLAEAPGRTVGYRIRREARVGPATRIEVLTEGLLTRMLQADPGLERAGLVIFDEFHERNLHGDLGLALTLQSRALLRPDLRILVMSATLDAAPVAALLGGAPVIRSEGRLHPVETRYRGRRTGARIEAEVAGAVRAALADTEGDVLVFLPGAGEIRRTARLLDDPPLPPEVAVLPLHGSLTSEQQDRVLLPAPSGQRKVILATSIAETSLTIEGIRAVIDAGLARVPRFSPRSGMTRLATVRVTRASADQRRGRAGRTGPGLCYRLWPEAEDHHLVPASTPEILEADLAPLALELAAHGVGEPGELLWLDPPPSAALAQARRLLRQLGALAPDGRITAHGRRMAELGTHPRLAHLLLRGAELGGGATAARLTALLEERDVLRGEGMPPDPDVRLRLDLLAEPGVPPAYHGWTVDRAAWRRIREESRIWRKAVRGAGGDGGEAPSAGALLALAYPDRVGQRRAGQSGRYLLRNGQGAATDAASLALADYLVAALLDGDRRESRIWLAAPITLAELTAMFGDQVERMERVEWTEPEGLLRAVEEERLGEIVLRAVPLARPDPARLAGAVEAWVRSHGLEVLPWDPEAQSLRARLAFLRGLGGVPGDWPDVSDAALLATCDRWLTPRLVGVRRRADLDTIDLAAALLDLVGWSERRDLERLAPTHLVVPSGSRIRLDYTDSAAPVLPVRLQELFGLAETPRIGGGRIPVTLHLLSPAHRPVQVTRDLAGFWREGYFEVRKELRGRYPKHAWPDDPLQAVPVRGRKRGTDKAGG